eukprot:TRINITY_DN2717_c0_g1_i1.p1 TRINITY_DN2717_c0_g1~~TRINITY_DN2717_c0_g1_i1.p1  ORF type:complete len:214 (+),score=40.58 TRINITY_DN2717_c0_g1_i1:1178-1819(+)
MQSPRGSTPNFQLYYYRAKGAADKVRILLEEAGVLYDDIYVKTSADISHLRCRMDCLPILVEKDSELVIPYAGCILRYLGQETRLYGSDIEERARVDIWMERFFELERLMWNASYNLVPETDVSKLLREKQKFISKTLEPMLTEMEDCLAGNENFYLVNKLSVADVCCFSVMDAVVREFGEEPLHEHRLIKFHYDAMRSRPRIESYLQSPRRP